MTAQTPTRPTTSAAAPVQAATTNATATTHHSEAPASGSVKAIDAAGYEWILTTRADTVADLVTRVTFLSAWLVDHGWTPTAPAHRSQTTTETETAPLCAIHGTVMQRRTKDGRSWWSCSEKLSDGSWCPYRPKS